MKSRQAFEGTLDAIVKNRLLEADNAQNEALFLIDTFMAESFFLVGVIEKNVTMERSMNCMFTRAQRVRELIEKVKKNPTKGNGGIDGDPIIIQR